MQLCTHTVWTDNGETESTTVIRICAINIGSGCDNPFSTGGAYGLCHQKGGPPGMDCPDYECDTKQLEAKSVNLNMNRAQTGVSPALPVPPPDASAPPPHPALHAPPPPSLPPPHPPASHPPLPSSPAVLRHRELGRQPDRGFRLRIRRRHQRVHEIGRVLCGSTLSW